MNILLLKPCQVMRNNLYSWLRNYFDASLTIAVATSYSRAVDIVGRGEVDIVIVKAGHGTLARAALLNFITQITGMTKIIIYAGHDISLTKENPYRHGVDGFISMWDIPDSLILCIKRVMRGFSYQSPLFI
ncbi:hypothetical protein [Serratia ureilytica]|uniref:hypothetical protein n=1 Tax=Serratia ureilytica TaxID=300181 RepID=UPI00214F418F|nr:hypothetical protein [Serratia ureilytica]UUW17343.1 hypothetical protein NAL25_19360 [Serratia ureilytica]